MGLHFQEGAERLPEGLENRVFPVHGTTGGTTRRADIVVDDSEATVLQLTALGAPADAKIVDGESPLTEEALSMPPETSRVLLVFQGSNADQIVQVTTACLEGVCEERRPFTLTVVLPNEAVVAQVWGDLSGFLDECQIGVVSADDRSGWARFRQEGFEAE